MWISSEAMMNKPQSSATASRVSRSIHATRLFFRRQLWIWPIVAAVILGLSSYFVRGVVESEVKKNLAAELQTILNADVAALEIWLEGNKRSVTTIVSDPNVYEPIIELVELSRSPDLEPGDLLQSEAQKKLKVELHHWMMADDFRGYGLVTKDALFLAGDRPEVVGRSDLPIPDGLFDQVFAGKATVTRPFGSSLVLKTEDGTSRAGVPTMYAVAPVHDASGEIVAALGFRIQPDHDFTRILSVASAGETGETYAFDKSGLLISQSRFDDQLKQIGLLTDNDETRSILNLQLRNPEVDMTRGHRPAKRRSEQPLTKMAADAIAGNSGIDVDGYSDYRGVQVIGAWTWLSDYEFGVASEVDVAEAYRPLYVLRNAMGALLVLLALSAVAIFVFTVVVARLNKSARAAAMKAAVLGQYSLDEKIGEGGMGVVYRGHHAMLRRPTAIKLLNADHATEDDIARFEREVQLTGKLNHPNTIAIYDYGRTPEGVFYYAMEYLDGMDLDFLGDIHGPQPEGRVIHILEQICGSLAEAHYAGLIHRDIKPANIILNQRGGLHDVVKVLDFGLVKAMDSQANTAITMAGTIIGTPLYMAPEGIESPDEVDARSDLYAIGAVGYFLLTGKPLFDEGTITQICMKQVTELPALPSERAETEIDDDLEQIIMRCLAKNPAERYQTASELEEALQLCNAYNAWTREDARHWWSKHSTSGSIPTAAIKPGAGDTAKKTATAKEDTKAEVSPDETIMLANEEKGSEE
jgi:serine/threonine protein kinase